MAKKSAKAEGKELVLASRAPALYNAISQIADLAAPFGEEPVAKVTLENIDKGVEVLARVREANRKLTALADEALADLKKQVKAIESERNKLRVRLTKADTAVAERIIALYREVSDKDTLAKRMEGALGSSATVTHKTVTVEVTNADAVPDEYLLPIPSRADRVNVAMVADAHKNGVAVPGTNVVPNYFLTTRASEIVK